MDEMLHNAAMLKKCSSIYNNITKIYAFVCGFYAIISLFMAFMMQSRAIIVLLDGIICKCALLFCGLMACYKHDTKFTLFAIIIATINIFISDGVDTFILPVNTIIFPLWIILSVITALTNKQYHFLENQFGFPYFSERFEQQKLDSCQRRIKDEFQQRYEKYTETSSSDMQEVSTDCKSSDMSGNGTSSAGQMDDI